MLEDFFARAMIGGVGMAACMGPFGAFVVWRRMAYFGDTLAHAALLGVAAGVALKIDLTVGIVATCIVVALLLVALRRRPGLSEDTILGILSHTALSLGLIALALMPAAQIDLMSFLFGDILAISAADILLIYAGGLIAVAVIVWLWRPLLAVVVNEDVARVEGVRVHYLQVTLMVLIALIIALAMKVVGVLLVTSLLIIPAASARRISRTPEQMAWRASVIGCVAVIAGLYASLVWDLPSGPAIVAAASILFSLSLCIDLFAGGARDLRT